MCACVCVALCVCMFVCVCVCMCVCVYKRIQKGVTLSDILADDFHGGVGRLRVANLDTAGRGAMNRTKTLLQ